VGTSEGIVRDSQVHGPVTPNRALLIEVTQREILEHGYNGVSLRSVARRADVDPGLVRHYFGSKENLLLQAVHADVDLADLAAEALRGTPGGIGRRAVRVLLAVWDHPGTSLKALARISASLNNTEAAEMTRNGLMDVYFGTIARAVSPDRPALRAALAASQMLGLAISRYLVEDPVLTAASTQDLIRDIGRAIQQTLTGPLPGEVAAGQAPAPAPPS
jgi:AcrR family transcriptional regulator